MVTLTFFDTAERFKAELGGVLRETAMSYRGWNDIRWDRADQDVADWCETLTVDESPCLRSMASVTEPLDLCSCSKLDTVRGLPCLSHKLVADWNRNAPCFAKTSPKDRNISSD